MLVVLVGKELIDGEIIGLLLLCMVTLASGQWYRLIHWLFDCLLMAKIVAKLVLVGGGNCCQIGIGWWRKVWPN